MVYVSYHQCVHLKLNLLQFLEVAQETCPKMFRVVCFEFHSITLAPGAHADILSPGENNSMSEAAAVIIEKCPNFIGLSLNIALYACVEIL